MMPPASGGWKIYSFVTNIITIARKHCKTINPEGFHVYRTKGDKANATPGESNRCITPPEITFKIQRLSVSNRQVVVFPGLSSVTNPARVGWHFPPSRLVIFDFHQQTTKSYDLACNLKDWVVSSPLDYGTLMTLMQLIYADKPNEW
jgi:hypothetical protein